MRFTTLIIFILILGGVFLGITVISDDLNTNSAVSGTEQINTSYWVGKYNYTNNINTSIGPVIEKFSVLEDEDKGFFSKLSEGIVAIPYAIIKFAGLVITSIGIMGTVTTTGLQQLKIPPAIIYVILAIITVFGIAKLLQFFNKTDTS